jgi:hypothetical protein
MCLEQLTCTPVASCIRCLRVHVLSVMTPAAVSSTSTVPCQWQPCRQANPVCVFKLEQLQRQPFKVLQCSAVRHNSCSGSPSRSYNAVLSGTTAAVAAPQGPTVQCCQAQQLQWQPLKVLQSSARGTTQRMRSILLLCGQCSAQCR